MEHLRSVQDTRAGRSTAESGHRAAAFLAEGVGTFALTLVAAGAEMVARMGLVGSDHIARAVAPGLLVGAFIYALGDASGAHFNPAVTLAFALKRFFPWRWVPGYWLSQLAGAILAAVVLRSVLGDVGDIGATTPHVPATAAIVLEVLLTWTLVTVILGTADRYRLIGPNAALAVGATIALCALWAGPLEGASMNPARSLGPALVDGGALADAWIYVVGPVVGAGLAVLTTFVLHGTEAHDPKQREAAQGKQQSEEGAPEPGRGERAATKPADAGATGAASRRGDGRRSRRQPGRRSGAEA